MYLRTECEIRLFGLKISKNLSHIMIILENHAGRERVTNGAKTII